MLGRSVRAACILAAVGLLLSPTGCLRNVKGKVNSGKDHRAKGAKKIELEDDEKQVKDIVTYPGGDRVDWKVVELPEGKKGDLRIRLKWKPARPGMDLSFDVYDEYFERVERAKPKRKQDKYVKKVRVANASGKYFIQVYASRRMDAGAYKLRVRFKERKQAKVPTADEMADRIPDPPTLPAVIEPEVKTPEQIAAEEEARKKQEEEDAKRAEEEEQRRLEEERLNKPVYAKIIKTQNASGGAVLITLNKGTDHGIERGWSGQVLRGRTKKGLSGGEFTLIRAGRTESIGKVKLSADKLRRNTRVELRRSSN